MGIERLKGSLLSEAEGEAGRIVGQAKAKAEALLAEERSRQERGRAEAKEEIQKQLDDQRNEKSAWARLEAKRIRAESEEDVIRRSLDEVIEALSRLRRSPEYGAFMAKAVEQGAQELGPGLIIHVQKGEKGLVPKLKNAKIAEDLEGLGGALMENADGTIRVDFTLETMIETKRDDLRKSIHTKIFGGR